MMKLACASFITKQQPRDGLRLELGADLSAGVGGAVHVDIEIPVHPSDVLRIAEERERRNRPGVVARLGQGDDRRTVLACLSLMYVGCRGRYTRGRNGTRDASTPKAGRSGMTLGRADQDVGGARSTGGDGRNLLASAELNRGLPAGHPGASCEQER